MFKKLFCTHDLDIIKEKEMISEFDIVRNAGLIPTPWENKTRKYIIIFKCNKCKKIKKEIFTTGG